MAPCCCLSAAWGFFCLKRIETAVFSGYNRITEPTGPLRGRKVIDAGMNTIERKEIMKESRI